MSEQGGELSLTLKYPEAKRYEGAPWVVFKGGVGEIRKQVAAYFGYAEDQIAGMTLHELTLLGNQSIRDTGKLAAVLGATPISQDASADAGPPWSTEPQGQNVWSQADGGATQAPAPAKAPENGGLIQLLTEAATIEDLKRLWATNKSAFDDKAVAEAYSA